MHGGKSRKGERELWKRRGQAGKADLEKGPFGTLFPSHQFRPSIPLSFILVQIHYWDEGQSGHSLLIIFFHEGIIMSTLQFQFLLAKDKEIQDS